MAASQKIHFVSDSDAGFSLGLSVSFCLLFSIKDLKDYRNGTSLHFDLVVVWQWGWSWITPWVSGPGGFF